MDITNKLDDLLSVILFLTPGFTTWIFFNYLTPSKKRSDLEITIFSIIISLFLSTGSFFALNFLTSFKQTQYFVYLINSSTFNIAITNSLIGIFLAYLFSKLLFRETVFLILQRFFKINVRPFSRTWDGFFIGMKENDVVKVVMSSGPNYIGVVKNYSTDPNDDIQELELWKPLYFGGGFASPTPIEETESVLLNSSNMLSIEKIYFKKASQLYPFEEKNLKNKKKINRSISMTILRFIKLQKKVSRFFRK